MEKSKSPGPNIEESLRVIEEYEKNPIVSNILAQETTFKKEVENFYDLSTWLKAIPRAGIIREFNFGNEDPQKNGRYPTNLVEILNNFSEKPFDINKLQYDSVREDYQRWHKPLRRVTRLIAGLGGMVIGAGGIVICVGSAINGKPEIAIPAGVIGVGGLVPYFWAMRGNPKPKGTNDELEEYTKLHESAKRADGFMDEHYRKHFIKKTLSAS